MSRTFFNAKLFSADISKWDVSNVRNMDGMFQNAMVFNGDVSKWDVSRVTNMDSMFRHAKSFKRKLCDAPWVHSKASKTAMFEGSAGSISRTVCTKTTPSAFSPQSKEELKSAVGSYLKPCPKDDCSEADNDRARTYKPQQLRGYQHELVDKATERDGNSIIYLPTGTGKTFVAVTIVERLLRKAAAAGRAHPLAIFLVDRIPLVFQQKEAFDTQYQSDTTTRSTGRYCGDMQKFDWREEFATRDVMCFTAGFFLNLLKANVISLQQVTVVVFDEVHHVRRIAKGESRHDFNTIMKEFYFTLAEADRPRVIGLTASPGGAVTLEDTRYLVYQLCYNLVRCDIC